MENITLKKKCENCGIEYEKYKSLSLPNWKKKRFCSYRCNLEYRKSNEQKTECICENCGKKFYLYPSRVKNGRGKNCSITCKAISNSRNQSGENNYNWHGGTHMKDGYRFIYSPNHPKKNATGYIREHIIIMEEKLGRYLEDREIVHHINHIKDDNRIENLMIMTPTSHMSMHTTERHKTDRNFNHRK
jgi:hypothetical protein